MDGITYKTVRFYGKHHVCMVDPVFSRPWYLKFVRNGRYEWTQNDLFGREYSLSTAQKHISDLEAGADKEWPEYHNTWKEYYKEIGVIKEVEA